MTINTIMSNVSEYYSDKIKKFGANNLGVDWSSEASQLLRFQQLSTSIVSEENFSITDIGCGYGAYLEYLNKHYKNFDYTGLDISEEMIEAAKLKYADVCTANFICSSSEKMGKTDYCIASGIFNVMLDSNKSAWEDYIHATLNQMNKHAARGFAFNCLTKYSDKECMKDYLYYADPLLIFDYCKKHYSRNVALLHDYDLYEFTIIVRKEHE